MADYKFLEISGVLRYADGAHIPEAPGNKDWQEYQDYVAGGGETDPWETDTEKFDRTLQQKLDGLYKASEKEIRKANKTNDHHQNLAKLTAYASALRRETKGTASAEDITYLDDMDADNAVVAAIEEETQVWDDWLNDSARTLQELKDFEPNTDPNWP
jgi:hypothetical protein